MSTPRPTHAADEMVTITIPRSALTVVAPAAVISSHTCLQIVGMKKEVFNRACKEGRIRRATHEREGATVWYAPAEEVQTYQAGLVPAARGAVSEVDEILRQGPGRRKKAG